MKDTGRNHGENVIALYDYAVTKGADYIFQTDSDGQPNPSEFHMFWEQRGEYDGIFGNRTECGDGKIRKFVENIVCLIVRLFFGVIVPDANAPFRLMSTETVKKYLYRLPPDYDIPNIMMTVYYAFYEERMKFSEVMFKSRQGGTNSINISNIIKIGCLQLVIYP